MRKKKNPRRKTWKSKTQQLSQHSKSRKSSTNKPTTTKATIVSNHLHKKDHSAKEVPLTNKTIINSSSITITIGRGTKSPNLQTKTIAKLLHSLASSNLGRVTPQTTPK